MGTDDFLKAFVELIAVDQKHLAAAEAFHLYISPQSKDLKPLAASRARVAFFHFDFIVKGRIRDHHGSSSIFTAAGTLGRPGIVRIFPVKGITKLLPAARRTSRMEMGNPAGAPSSVGSSEKLDGVLAMQI